MRKRDEYDFYLILYVDDLILACNNIREIIETKAHFSREFEMTDIGELRYFLGIKIEYDSNVGIMELSQKHYLEKILQRFGMAECNGISTPMEANLKLSYASIEEGECTEPYRELIGCLMYAMLQADPTCVQRLAILAASKLNQQLSIIHICEEF